MALFATRTTGYWYDTNLSARMTSAVRQGPSEEYQGESIWRVTVEVSVPMERAETFETRLREAFNAAVVPEVMGAVNRAVPLAE